TQRQQVVGTATRTVGYAYQNGDLVTLTTPSGQQISYGYANHRITSIAINGNSLLSQAVYSPFGSVHSWVWGNGTSTRRDYDADGRLVTISSSGSTTFTYYPDGTIHTATQDSPSVLSTASAQTTLLPAANSNQLSSVTGQT